MFTKLSLPEGKTVDYLRIGDRKVGVKFRSYHNMLPSSCTDKVDALIWTPEYYLHTERALWYDSLSRQIFQPVPATSEIPSGMRHSVEGDLTTAMLMAVCNDYRKAHPEYGEYREPDIYGNPQTKNLPKHLRGFFWKKAVKIAQGMMYKIIDEMPEDHLAILKATRRYVFHQRGAMYAWLSEESVRSNRCLQLVDTAPIAAYKIANYMQRGYDRLCKEQAQNWTELVHNGIKVKLLMDEMQIPRWATMIQPRHTMWMYERMRQSEMMYRLNAGRMRQAVDACPDKRSLGRIWHHFAEISGRAMSEEHFYWMLTHMWDLMGDALMFDVSDYFTALYEYELRQDRGNGQPWLDWNPKMGFDATMERCDQWHADPEVHAAYRANRRYNGPFPEPWIPGIKKGGYEIVPILTGADLAEEGKRMHHCVAGYDKPVLRGDSYIYSVRKGGRRKTTIEIGKSSSPGEPVVTYRVRQNRGPCNADPTKEVKKLVDEWIAAFNKQQWEEARKK